MIDLMAVKIIIRHIRAENTYKQVWREIDHYNNVCVMYELLVDDVLL